MLTAAPDPFLPDGHRENDPSLQTGRYFDKAHFGAAEAAFRRVPEAEEWLASRIGYRFADPLILRTALTHFSLRRGTSENYERLEFLGDALINLCVTEVLLKAGGWSEQGLDGVGDICSNAFLATASQRAGLSDFLLRGNAEPQHDKTKADLVESVAAAIYRDSGSMSAVEAFVSSVLSTKEDYRQLDRRASKAGSHPAAYQEESLSSAMAEFVKTLAAGEDGRFIPESLLDDAATGEGRRKFSPFYTVGTRVHALLCREVVYDSLPESDEGVLTAAAIKAGTAVIRAMARQPAWAAVEDSIPNCFVAGTSEQTIAKSRLFSLLGALYLGGGMDAVHAAFGSRYRDAYPESTSKAA